MKRNITIITIWLFTSIILNTSLAQQEDLTKLVKKVQPAVVTVLTYDINKYGYA